MRFKSLTAVLLAAIMVLSSMSVFAASTFTDVADDYWAKDYIEEMYSIGLIKGYPDGTFGPSNAVSKWESLILAARVLGFNDAENAPYIELAADQYMSKLAKYNVNNKNEICYLLYWGAIDEDDLADYLTEDKKNSPELRYEASVLLTKVMGGEAEALGQSSVVLDYDDASDIPTAAKPYVSYVTSIKVMQGTGNNKFDPLMQVSRAQMSTMMYNTMRAMKLESKEVTVQSTLGSQKQITAYDNSGVSEKFTADDDTIYRADGAPATINDITAGTVLKLNFQGDKLRLVEWNSDNAQYYMEGKVASCSGNTLKLEVLYDDGSTRTETFNLIPTAKVYLDGDSIGISQIKSTHYATVYYTGDNNVYEVRLERMTTSVNGAFVEYGLDPNTVTISLSDGSQETYYLADKVGILKNDKNASMYDIAKGDRVLLTLEYHMVIQISSTSVDQTVEGTIKEVTFGDTNRITIKLSDSSIETFNITENTVIKIDDADSNMYALRPGAQAKIVAQSTNATRISSYAVVAPSQIVGTVTAVNPTYKIVTINNVETGEDQQVVIKDSATIIDNTKSGITTLSKLKPGYQILVLGNMSNGTYIVNTLIVTQ